MQFIQCTVGDQFSAKVAIRKFHRRHAEKRGESASTKHDRERVDITAEKQVDASMRLATDHRDGSGLLDAVRGKALDAKRRAKHEFDDLWTTSGHRIEGRVESKASLDLIVVSDKRR
jgi:hypothetical protein